MAAPILRAQKAGGYDGAREALGRVIGRSAASACCPAAGRPPSSPRAARHLGAPSPAYLDDLGLGSAPERTMSRRHLVRSGRSIGGARSSCDGASTPSCTAIPRSRRARSRCHDARPFPRRRCPLRLDVPVWDLAVTAVPSTIIIPWAARSAPSPMVSASAPGSPLVGESQIPSAPVSAPRPPWPSPSRAPSCPGRSRRRPAIITRSRCQREHRPWPREWRDGRARARGGHRRVPQGDRCAS